VTLFLGSVMLIGGSVQVCEAEREEGSEYYSFQGPGTCHIVFLTWVDVPAGVSRTS